jgi:hypothetical protein
MSEKDVHTEHCCIIHGCKYNDENCTVANGIKTQSFPCEWCDEEEKQKSPLEQENEKLRQAYARLVSQYEKEETVIWNNAIDAAIVVLCGQLERMKR